MPVRSKDDTPAMRQYHSFKRQHPDCVLFFRMGDFYEMFYDDAKLAHKVLGVALTQRSNGIPLAGVPFHAVEAYLRRMIEAGYRAAVCEQIEDPAVAKGVVKRDVTRVITPGTLTDESLLDESRENPLAALVPHSGNGACVAWAELSTGAFSASTFTADELHDELVRIGPRELLYLEDDTAPATIGGRNIADLAEQIGAVPTARPAWQFGQSEAAEILKRQFQVAALAGFGFRDDEPVIRPIAAVIHYLLETQKSGDGSEGRPLAHLRPPLRFAREAHMVIDQVSLRSLEIDRTMRSGQTLGSLLGVMQQCTTAMGKRLLRHSLCYPLRHRAQIEQRQRVVAALVDDGALLEALRGAMEKVQDVPRTVARLSVGRAAPRDLVALGNSAAQAARIVSILADRPAVRPYFDALDAIATDLTRLADTICAACVQTPPAHLREGGLIRDGFDEQLDEARTYQRDSQGWLARYQKQLIEETGIATLKIAFNRVFGYFIEVTAANRDRAPDSWSRKQTLKNAERFITPPLKQFEDKILGAEQRAIAREQALFTRLCDDAVQHVPGLNAFADVVAALDVLACFARRAVRHRYVQPRIVDDPVLHIEGGRHPVLDELLGDRFVPNDVGLGSDGATERRSDEGGSGQGAGATLALITGPNMAGKSTYIRQTALITLLAHTGSFVPADSATIGLCDRIFTRVGASDELHAGQSTFMVEMTETASICHHATASSLVVLDEIGRGTSTLDGLALAWAITEHLSGQGCRTLFATHYHELTVLAETFANVINLNVTVREWKDQIVFLHRIVPGATSQSYGIHVAKIAGIPTQVIDRASALLAQLEVSHHQPASEPRCDIPGDNQMQLFTQYLNHPAVDRLREVNLDALSPIQAFETLRHLREIVDLKTRDTGD